jgi:diketogulonate reductase-like aldo/keto reductase
MNLPSIGIGTSGYGGYFSKSSNYSDLSKFVDIIRLGYDLGARVVDTAESYAAGGTEEIIGSLPPSIKNDLFIMSKFSPENSSNENMKASLHNTLKRLKRDYVDVYMPHWPSANENVLKIMDQLMRFVEEGKVRNIGVSNYSLSQYTDAYSHTKGGVNFVQAEYGPFERTAEDDLLPKVISNHSMLVGYSPFRHGEVFNKQGLHYKELVKIASEVDCTISQLVLLWITRSGSVITIPRTVDKNRMKENLQALYMNVSPEVIKRLSKLFIKNFTLVDTNLIMMEEDGDRPVYYNLDDALRNKFNLFPGPLEIVDEIKSNNGTLIKPIKLKKIINTNKYIVCEGRLKYWAWIILYGNCKKIPSIIIG